MIVLKATVIKFLEHEFPSRVPVYQAGRSGRQKFRTAKIA
jgi:hypothetical protein